MDKNSNMDIDYKNLIIKYLTGSMLSNEEEMLLNWIASDKKNEETFNKMYEAWIISGSEKGKRDFEPRLAWNNLSNKIQKGNKIIENREGKTYYFRYLRKAASWLIVFSLGLTAMYMIKGKPEAIPSTSAELSSKSAVIINVPDGSRSNVVLPDGSQVWVNSGSKIIYNQDYGIESRRLFLIGEAYFDVARDKEKAFIVDIGGVEIEALGTRFNVKSYPEEKTVSATLEEGRIEVNIPKIEGDVNTISLSPNQNIVLHKSTEQISKTYDKESLIDIWDKDDEVYMEKLVISDFALTENVNTRLYTSWKDQEWILERLTLGDLALILERRYDVEIVFAEDILKNYNFTGTIQNESIEQILNAISMSAPVNYSIQKDTITFTINTLQNENYQQILKEPVN